MLHPYPKLLERASKTFNWMASDTLENYKADNNLYSTSNIKYQYNTDGFRCDELNLDSSYPVIYFGCSITEGIGINLHESWTSILHSQITCKIGSIPYWNIGMAGAGIDTCAKFLY